MIERRPITDRAEWLMWRRQDLTMSEIGAVAGVGLYGTPFDVWAVKAGLASPPEENSAMTLGRWCEPAVVCALREKHPEFTINYPLDVYVRDPDLRLGGTPDATGFEGRIIPHVFEWEADIVFEFKVISRQSHERHWAAGPPIAYQLQTLGNAMLLDADYGILAALVMGFQDVELVVHRIDRHAEAEAGIRDIARRFWEALDDGHALAAPDYQRDADIIRQVFRPDRDKPAPLDLSGDNRLAEILVEREEARQIAEANRKMVKEIDAEIVHKLNGATSAIAGGWKISQSTIHVAEQLRAAYDYSQLRITPPKESTP